MSPVAKHRSCDFKKKKKPKKPKQKPKNKACAIVLFTWVAKY